MSCEQDDTAIPRLSRHFPFRHAKRHVSMLGAGEESGVSLFGVGNRFFQQDCNLISILREAGLQTRH